MALAKKCDHGLIALIPENAIALEMKNAVNAKGFREVNKTCSP